MSKELPVGWIISSLENVAEINLRHPRSLDDSLPVTFAPMTALSETRWSIQLTGERLLGAVRKGYTHFAEGDVLFAKITPCMENGKAALAIGLKNGLGCGSTELHVLRPRKRIDSKYLYYFVHQESFRKEAARNFTGTAGQLRVPVSFIRAAEIPLPPLNEQRRIVAKLEKLLTRVEACKERLDNIPPILKRFRQSVLAAACSGRLTADWRNAATEKQLQPSEPANPKGVIEVEELIDVPTHWRWLPLQALCDRSRVICYGVIKLGTERRDGIPCLRTSDVKPLYIDTTDVKRIAPEIFDRYRRTSLHGGEVLISVRGTLGGVAAVPDILRGWNISREVAMVPVHGVLSKFVAFWIASIPCQNWFSGVEKGVAYTGINIEDLRLLPVALPSVAEQQEIVHRVEALFKIADLIEERYKKAKAHVHKLTQSVLAKAFRGELAPHDPNDEPASELLVRIKEERSKRELAHE